MTLPEALLKRLAKRGIIPDAQKVGANQNQPPLLSAGTADEDSDQDNKERDSENTSDQSDEKDDDVDDNRRDAEVINEEIIAEDYDEYDQVNPEAYEYASKKKSTPALEWTEKMKQKMTKRYGYQSVDGCQNKYNIYHLCTMYCVKRYGEVEFEIEKEYEKRTKRLLERYPLPKNWRKEYDIGCKAFYFYNKDTRVVAWLPPTHPDAKLTKSAKQLRRELMEEQKQKDAASEATPPTVIVESYPPPAKPLIGPTNTTALGSSGNVGPAVENLKPPIVNPPKRPAKQHPGSGEREDEKRQRTFSSGNDSGAADSGAADPGDRDRDYRDRNRDRRERDRDRDRDRDRRGDRDRSPPARGDDNRFGARDRDRNRDRDRDRDYRDHRDRRPPRGPPKSAPLDPMDPAAYSDIPRGTWSAGLEAQSQSATGSKKEKSDRKKPQLTSPKSDGDEEDGDEGAHEVLKISAVQEFHQDEDVDDEVE
ncbi:AGAP011757-PA-like protein [Anopheles sinensis]|uniref:AGAP011757-PA-like protein n=1 Tax=Anopheles sinensis TaxID=74873 RepID=A0A084WJ43_ANOSI|nr:AGAP011757-PA-like protein [Anopheles sinensis]